MPVERRFNGKERMKEPYTADRVSLLLHFPSGRATEMLPISDSPEDRIDTYLQPSKVEYTGGFYLQGNETTCMPWSIGNAITVLGEDLQPLFMKDMLNHALGFNSHSTQGMRRLIAPTLINNYPGLSVKAEKIDDIIAIEEEEIIADYFPTTYQKKPFETIVRDNAFLIKDAIDTQAAIVASVKVDNADPHAVCIAGYEVDKQRNMNLQIIDSNTVTSSTKSIEDVTRELNIAGIFKVEKKKHS